MKQAVVVVSFGTSHPEALKAIEGIEQAAEAHCGQKVFRAFTSGFLCRKLKEQHQIEIPSPSALFAQLTAEGYDSILCLPTHVIPGIEYHRLRSDAAAFPQVRIAHPLLWSERDYVACANAVIRYIPQRQDGEALLLMGHGTAHSSNTAYSHLERTFRSEGHENVYVGTAEGYPVLDDILPQLVQRGTQKVMLMPFLIVAGEHARTDLAGAAADSWKSRLEALGIETRTVMNGLGEIPEIAQRLAAQLDTL